jgi:hypothetical protein
MGGQIEDTVNRKPIPVSLTFAIFELSKLSFYLLFHRLYMALSRLFMEFAERAGIRRCQ